MGKGIHLKEYSIRTLEEARELADFKHETPELFAGQPLKPVYKVGERRGVMREIQAPEVERRPRVEPPIWPSFSGDRVIVWSKDLHACLSV
jgi:hypothetical protein